MSDNIECLKRVFCSYVTQIILSITGVVAIQGLMLLVTQNHWFFAFHPIVFIATLAIVFLARQALNVK